MSRWRRSCDQALETEKIGLDPEAETPGRQVVRHIGQSLVKAMDMALTAGDRAAAEIVAAECVVEAEMKDHLTEKLKDATGKAEEEEDAHLYHTTGWTRAPWVLSLGMPAARTKKARSRMRKAS